MTYICDNCEKYPCTDDDYKMRFTCPGFSEKPKPMTNADFIRAMTDEQMAKWLARSEYNHLDFFAGELQKHAHITVEYPKDEAKLTEEILEWLKAEVSE